MNIKLLFFILFFLGTNSHAKIVERIVAIVNNEIITMSDIEAFKVKLKKGGLVDDTLMQISNPDDFKKNDKAIIDYLLNEKILDSEIKIQNMQITVERVEQEMRTIAQKNNINRSQLKEALKRQGVAFSEYQNFVKKSIERQSLIEKEVTSKVKISDEEISEYYIQNSSNKDQQTYSYTLSHILFLSKNGGLEKAKERAALVYKKLLKKESFNNLASQFSEDPDFTQGGFLGKFNDSELNSIFKQAVSPLKEGDFSKVIRIGNNFHILKLTKKTLVPSPHFTSQKSKIKGILFAKAFKKSFSNWLEKKKQEAFIKINI